LRARERAGVLVAIKRDYPRATPVT
jgi:hypothetical protein